MAHGWFLGCCRRFSRRGFVSLRFLRLKRESDPSRNP
jgi:hypothetical protein